MKSETKTCQNCKNKFVIEPEDFEFYSKIKVPPPTFCPECRMQRRMSFMNERALYKRKCNLCSKDIVSIFPVDTNFTVYCSKCWWDKWERMEYGKDYDFSQPFFNQLSNLIQSVPWPGRFTVEPTLINSDYCNICSYLKNCYLLFNSDYSEDCLYGTYVEHSKDSMDLYMADECELCYSSNNLDKCHRVFFSSNCNDCVDVFFSRNLVGCLNCFGCVNLRNKQYYIFNQPYSKEAYFSELKKFNFASYVSMSEFKKRAEEFWLKYPKKFAEGLQNLNVSGDYIFNSKNTFQSYEVGGCEDCKYCQFLFLSPVKDCYDVTMWGENLSRSYECMGAGGGQSDSKFCFDTWSESPNLEYSLRTIVTSSNLFGCYGLRNKQYCILNKQYSKEDYEKLMPKIIEHMNSMPYVDKKGIVYKYGEFFPSELSPFAYNETIAQEYFPLTKEQALEQRYSWRDPETKDIKITVKVEELPDHIKDVSDDILNQIIGCAHEAKCNEQCTLGFKIIPQELEFYRKMNLPLPRLCPNCRHYQRLKQRNPLKLWHRKCTCGGSISENGIYQNTATHFHGSEHCPNEFETSYAPERPEIVYCEACYNAEVV